MDKLIDYLNSLDKADRAVFAKACGTSENYMRKARSSGQKFSWERCIQIEQASKGKVTRKDLRDDWHVLWPDLTDEDIAESIRSIDDTQPPVGGVIKKPKLARSKEFSA